VDENDVAGPLVETLTPTLSRRTAYREREKELRSAGVWVKLKKNVFPVECVDAGKASSLVEACRRRSY